MYFFVLVKSELFKTASYSWAVLTTTICPGFEIKKYMKLHLILQPVANSQNLVTKHNLIINKYFD